MQFPRMPAILLFVMACLVPAVGQQQSSPAAAQSQPVVQQSQPVAPQPKQGRLGELERKAEERDQMVRRCLDLETELAHLRDILADKAGSASSSTNVDASAGVTVSNAPPLPDKSHGESAVVITIERLRVLQETVRGQGERIRDLDSQVAALVASNAALTATNAAIIASNKRLLAGNYEFYEVRKGDTLETIAARKQVYGTAARAEWLRQANRQRVQDLDNLRTGEVLVVPRYPPGGDFDF